MSSIKELMESKAYKQFMRKLLIYALPVFVLGIFFMIKHWSGGDVMVIAGGSCLILLMVFFLIEKIVVRK